MVCTTEEELYKFNPSSEKIINYPLGFFPGKSNFNEGAALRTQSEYLIVQIQ